MGIKLSAETESNLEMTNLAWGVYHRMNRINNDTLRACFESGRQRAVEGKKRPDIMDETNPMSVAWLEGYKYGQKEIEKKQQFRVWHQATGVVSLTGITDTFKLGLIKMVADVPNAYIRIEGDDVDIIHFILKPGDEDCAAWAAFCAWLLNY